MSQQPLARYWETTNNGTGAVVPLARYTTSGKRVSVLRGQDIPGTRKTAVILDMDGTLEDYGRVNHFGMSYARKAYKEGHTLVVITARGENEMSRTFRWLTRNLRDEKGHLMPFIGPFCRQMDDMRWACDFKNAVRESLSGIYDFVSAIDDDRHVLAMWRSVPGLDVVECKPTVWYPRGKAEVGYDKYIDDKTLDQYWSECRSRNDVSSIVDAIQRDLDEYTPGTTFKRHPTSQSTREFLAALSKEPWDDDGVKYETGDTYQADIGVTTTSNSDYDWGQSHSQFWDEYDGYTDASGVYHDGWGARTDAEELIDNPMAAEYYDDKMAPADDAEAEDDGWNDYLAWQQRNSVTAQGKCFCGEPEWDTDSGLCAIHWDDFSGGR